MKMKFDGAVTTEDEETEEDYDKNVTCNKIAPNRTRKKSEKKEYTIAPHRQSAAYKGYANVKRRQKQNDQRTQTANEIIIELKRINTLFLFSVFCTKNCV